MPSTSYGNQTKWWRKTSVFSQPTKTASSCSCSLTWLTTLFSGCGCHWVLVASYSPYQMLQRTQSWSKTPPLSSWGQSSNTCWTRYWASSTPTMVGILHVHSFPTCDFMSHSIYVLWGPQTPPWKANLFHMSIHLYIFRPLSALCPPEYLPCPGLWGTLQTPLYQWDT